MVPPQLHRFIKQSTALGRYASGLPRPLLQPRRHHHRMLASCVSVAPQHGLSVHREARRDSSGGGFSGGRLSSSESAPQLNMVHVPWVYSTVLS